MYLKKKKKLIKNTFPKSPHIKEHSLNICLSTRQPGRSKKQLLQNTTPFENKSTGNAKVLLPISKSR